MNILIVDKLSPEVVKSLEALGLQVEVRDYLDSDSLPGALKFTDILVVRSTKVTTAAIKAAPLLSLIIRAGAGVDNIDLAAASAQGHLCGQLPRQEYGRRGRIGHRSSGCRRPPHRRRHHEHAQRHSGRRRNSARPAAWPGGRSASLATGQSAGRRPNVRKDLR